MYALVDTATEVTVVNGENSSNCNGDLYDPTGGEGQAFYNNLTTTAVPYGSGLFIAYEAKDDFCLVLDECVEDMSYLFTTTPRGPLLDSQLGTAPTKNDACCCLKIC